MGFKALTLYTLLSIERKLETMSQQIDDFVSRVNASFAQLGDSLTNIAADEDNLAKQIAILAQQIADLIANGGTVGADDLEKLNILANAAQAMADRTKGIADGVADVVPAPPTA